LARYYFDPPGECHVTNRPYRVLAVASHPVQYMSPVLRKLAQAPEVELRVAYCSLRGADAMYDPEFNATVKWDIPLLDGYEWVEMANRGSGEESFFGLNNPGLWKEIRTGKYDAVLCYVSYLRASFWISYAACKISKTAFLFGTDASSLVSREASRWKYYLKRAYWPLLFSLADQVFVPSSATRDLMLAVRVPSSKISLTPYVVDNDWWVAESGKANREAVRASWGVGSATAVILFCAKLQPWKRPMDVLLAFAKLSEHERKEAILVYAGEGHQRVELEKHAAALGVADRVRFLGFINQSQLPGVYTSADLMVLPSEYEPFAVVVNVASWCGCPGAVSDRVGAGRDLVEPVNPDLIFPCGDIAALTSILRNCIVGRERFGEAGRKARIRMETWSLRESIAGAVEAVQRAVFRAGRSWREEETPGS
jgi:glycosyltransferase involved in cell wall biosynthesis